MTREGRFRALLMLALIAQLGSCGTPIIGARLAGAGGRGGAEHGTARTSPFIPGLGYGYLWWVFDPADHKGTALDGAYTASGAFGQYISVIPGLDMVVAHKTAVPPPRNVTSDVYFGTILPRAVALVEPSR